QFQKMTDDCLKQHMDGTPWGFRALLPGVQVKDYAPQPDAEDSVSADSAYIDEEFSPQEDSSVGTMDSEEPTASEAASELVQQPSEATDALETTPEIVQQPSEDVTVSEATPELVQQPSEAIDAPGDTPEVTQQLIEDVNALEDTPGDREQPFEEENELETTTKRPAIRLDALAEPVADQAAPSAWDKSAEELAHPEAPSEPDVTPSASDAVPTSSTQISTPDDETALPAATPLAQPEQQVAEEENEEAERADAATTETAADESPTDLSEGLATVSSPDEAQLPDEQEAPHEDDASAASDEQARAGTEVALLPVATVASPTQATGPHLLPKFARGKRSTFVRIAQRRRTIRRRWIRDTQDKGKQKRLLRVVSIAIVAVILLGMLLPVGVGLAAYGVYNNVSDLAHSGINHLFTVKDLLTISKSDPMAALNAAKLTQARDELKAAESDFEQLQQLANRPDIQSVVQQYSPSYAGKLVMARHLLQVALDVSRMGQELSSIGIIASGILHSSPLASSSAQPLISVQNVAQIKGAIVHALYYIDDIQQNMSQVQLNDLPINAKEKTQLASVMTELPTIRTMIVQNQSLVDVVTWLLGVGQPRHFLVQTMDNAELRPGGGFTGQYGLLTINNGRMDPFTLRDVALLDYAGNGMELGRQAPPQYRSWMNFGNWGLRDSNLSGDYPTTARINMQVFQEEGGGPVDGDIAFTPTFIGHIIDVTGPIHVAEYNETITSANLADRLHYYQQDYNAIAIEHQKSNDNSHQARKAFTSLLGRMLLDRLRHLPTKQLLNVIKVATKDLRSRDLEIYFNNTAAEQWLTNYGYSGGLDTFSKQDGFVLTQANISISKASQYVHTTEQDNIALDAQGGATHNLTITLDYNQTGPVYGYDTYTDYMRVYVPRSSQLQGGDGFDSGHALCAPSAPAVGRNGRGTTPVYSGCNSRAPSSSLYCPSGNYNLGMRGYQRPWTVDAISGPTATTSDLPGRGMFGGLTATPKNCTATITLSWYVPNAVKHNGKHLSYTLFVQKQGGYIPTLDVTIDTSAIKGLKPFSFKGPLTADRAFTLSS
ncbi:MAG: DUF4012 domain-containing protein, partial [Chloroflexota bacterium]|nr:DUF4012 domain-containing protein [Chloroflexota bacterium]